MPDPGSTILDRAEIERYAQWVGQSATLTERIAAQPLEAWSATLDREDAPPQEGDALPALSHWLYFLPRARQSLLGEDGHPARGGFLPPVRLPRRMWAGGRIWWHQPLCVGDEATRTSQVQSVTHKRGQSGDLVFVVVKHVIATQRGPVLTEEHDIVYREAVSGHVQAAPAATEAQAAWRRMIEPTDVLLFRYSALTFNGHRIHYDRRYVTEVEGYPGLVVHGPLIATLLVDAARRHLGEIEFHHFEFKALRPLFDTEPFEVCGRLRSEDTELDLWSCNAQGALTMKASARVRLRRHK
ncbi:MAG: MaoC family dehydratase N-terminal domain-containing protein [Burkholderiaceae bacterium]|jgi:3-methylfumaryl-CoA hydratase